MWTYDQSTGKITNGTLTFQGYSGAPGHVDDPAAQDIPNVGPIPCWDYIIGIPFDDPKTGPYSIRLSPNPSPLPDGRSGFLMHGDSIQHPGCGSEGCIVMPGSARMQIWNSGDHDLKVVSGNEPPAPPIT